MKRERESSEEEALGGDPGPGPRGAAPAGSLLTPLVPCEARAPELYPKGTKAPRDQGIQIRFSGFHAVMFENPTFLDRLRKLQALGRGGSQTKH